MVGVGLGLGLGLGLGVLPGADGDGAGGKVNVGKGVGVGNGVGPGDCATLARASIGCVDPSFAIVDAAASATAAIETANMRLVCSGRFMLDLYPCALRRETRSG
jgi:hypothetical protein